MAIKGKGAKRTASSDAASVAKKCRKVGEVLNQTTGFPPSAVKMCCMSIGESLGVAADERHQFQNDTVAMIGKMLGGVESGLREEVQAAAAKLHEAKAAPGEIGIAHDKAEQNATSKHDAVAAANTAHRESGAALEAAQKAKADAEAEQKKGDRELAELTGKLSKLEECLANVYTPLKEGGVIPAGKVKAKAQSVAQHAKSLGVDQQVCASLSHTLARTPEARGTYDQLILDSVNTELSTHHAELKRAVDAGTPGTDARAAKVAAAAASYEDAVAKAKACKDALIAAKADDALAKAALKNAAKDIGPFAKGIKKAKDKFDAANDKLSAFGPGPLAYYSELKNRSNPVPERPIEHAASA